MDRASSLQDLQLHFRNFFLEWKLSKGVLEKLNDIFCPKCSSKNTCRIVWGYPSSNMMKLAQEGKVVLGGCIISDNDPMWHCLDCSNHWGRRKDYE